MRRISFFLFALLLLLVGALPTAAASNLDNTPTTDLSRIVADTYTLDSSHTSILFRVMHLGFSGYFGRFNEMAGTLDFDPANPAASRVAITIPVASVDTNSPVLEEKLRGADWFNAGTHPTASFVSEKITVTGNNTGTIIGKLTLMGVSQPVTLDVTFNGAGVNPYAGAEVLGFSARGRFLRSAFGLENLVPAVGDMVDLVIEAEFTRPIPTTQAKP